MVSPCFCRPHPYQIIVQTGFSSAAKAYNDAIERSTNDLIVFAHQDIVFPEAWLTDLERALDSLKETDPRWGVLGCYGQTLHDGGRGHVYSGGLNILGKPFDRPARIQTLDEIVLILRKSTGLKFDEQLPHFHFYGTDICMIAASHGLSSYAISAFCIHNTQQNFVLPKELDESYRHLKRKWSNFLPIRTTCVEITKFGLPVHRRRLREAYLSLARRNNISASRMKDGRMLLSELEGVSRNGPEVAPDSSGCLSR